VSVLTSGGKSRERGGVWADGGELAATNYVNRVNRENVAVKKTKPIGTEPVNNAKHRE